MNERVAVLFVSRGPGDVLSGERRGQGLLLVVIDYKNIKMCKNKNKIKQTSTWK